MVVGGLKNNYSCFGTVDKTVAPYLEDLSFSILVTCFHQLNARWFFIGARDTKIGGPYKLYSQYSIFAQSPNRYPTRLF